MQSHLILKAPILAQIQRICRNPCHNIKHNITSIQVALWLCVLTEVATEYICIESVKSIYHIFVCLRVFPRRRATTFNFPYTTDANIFFLPCLYDSMPVFVLSLDVSILIWTMYARYAVNENEQRNSGVYFSVRTRVCVRLSRILMKFNQRPNIYRCTQAKMKSTVFSLMFFIFEIWIISAFFSAVFHFYFYVCSRTKMLYFYLHIHTNELFTFIRIYTDCYK